jgi:hypothetical protein
MKNILFVLAALLFVMGCKQQPENAADSIYFGGDIITMEGDSAIYVEAVAVKDGELIYVGSKNEAMKFEGTNTRLVDLQGKTLVPGFIDGHAHFFGFGAQAVAANLLAPPDGKINNIDDLISELKTWYDQNGTDKTQGWIFGIGFDDAVLKENRFPTKVDLDKVSTDVPVIITHISGHFAVMNSKGLELRNITSETKNPTGGVIRRMSGSNEPNGVLEELAAIQQLSEILYPSNPEISDYYMDKAQEMAVKFGFTTAQEGRTFNNHELLASFAERGKFKIDIVSYIDYTMPQYFDSKWNSKEYINHYRIGGYKLTLDGSPQGRTAWRTQPYLIPPDGQSKDYAGYPVIPDEKDVREIIERAVKNGWQLLTHANGDAAIDQLIRNYRYAVDQYGNEGRRDVLIHGQYVRMDQLDSLKKLNMIASLFPMHTFYWGDWHRQIIGKELADKISPIKSALNKGIIVTSHTDAPVALPNLIMVLWTTVNRVSRSGEVIGPEERLTPYEALKTITIWGAYQHFEENKKGSLVEGKLADLVILSDNPLKIEPMNIKDIQVLETIKEGETVFKKS